MTIDNGDRSGSQLRAVRRQRARDEVRATALRLFAAKGFDAVTIEDIASQTHISQRTFFRYFANKEDLLFDPESHLALLGELVRDRPASESPQEALRNSFVEIFKLFDADRRSQASLRKIIAKKPSLISRSTGQLLVAMDPVVDILAERMECRAEDDMRPMVLVATGLVTSMAVIRMWSLEVDDSMANLFSRFKLTDVDALVDYPQLAGNQRSAASKPKDRSPQRSRSSSSA